MHHAFKKVNLFRVCRQLHTSPMKELFYKSKNTSDFFGLVFTVDHPRPLGKAFINSLTGVFTTLCDLEI